VTLLLTINSELIKELIKLQMEGKAAPQPLSPPHGPSPHSDNADHRDGADGAFPMVKPGTGHVQEFAE
jgi:hypothetical protein